MVIMTTCIIKMIGTLLTMPQMGIAFVYYQGENDAWIGYGGAVINTRDNKLTRGIVTSIT